VAFLPAQGTLASLECPANGYLVPSAGALDWYPPSQEPRILDLIAFD
jgi:hypothetical protein